MRLRQRLAGLGFHECQTIKLISDKQLADALPLKPLRDGDTIRVSLPLSEDHAVMRPSLAPGLIASAGRNLRQGAESLRLFEMGRFFRNAGGGKATDLEADALAILVSGLAQPTAWDRHPRTADLFDLLGVIQSLVPGAAVRLSPRERDGQRGMTVPVMNGRPGTSENWVLRADIMAAGQNLGSFAMLSPARQRDLDAPDPVFVAELDLAKLRKLSAVSTDIQELPQFPGSSRDVSIDAAIDLPNAEIEKALSKVKEPLLVGSACVDLFTDPEGAKIAADRKAVTYRLLYRSPLKTLQQQEIDQAHKGILEHLTKALPVGFR
jgi:phenylalanyl-tRNA synthetase beta chain